MQFRERLPAMPAWLERAIGRVQEWTARLIAFLQPIVVSVLLFIVYLLGVGLTRLGCMLFARRVLAIDQATEANGSFWRDVEGYDPDPVRLHKQM